MIVTYNHNILVNLIEFCIPFTTRRPNAWGQGKPTARISANVNGISAYSYYYPPTPACWLYTSGGKRKVIDVRRECVR
jgi:hypothetical protein